MIKKSDFKDIPNKKLLIASLIATPAIVGTIIMSPPQTSQINQNSTKQMEQATQAEQEQFADQIETKTISETNPIPFSAITKDDSSLESGVSKISTVGENGEKTTIYEVTYTNGQETSRRKIKDETTKPAINQVTSIGTKPRSNCDPNYSGACVPIASDVDCAGGSGNGPAYVAGPVYITGYDKYGLDRDGDGVGCTN